MDELAKDQFARELQHALTALYDPAVLKNSLLVTLLEIQEPRDPVSALRRMLTEAIEALRPNEPMPRGSHGWRVYQVLRRRYIEQLTQHEVAQDLGLSIRQLQREEKIAREALADRLWAEHNVGARAALLTGVTQPEDASSTPPSTAQELKTLSDATSFQVIQLGDVIREVLDTLQPLLSATHTNADCELALDLPPVTTKPSLLRQALLNLASVAVQRVAGGRLVIKTEHDPSCARITLLAFGRSGISAQDTAEMAETLEMAGQLLAFSQGTLHLTEGSTAPAESAAPAFTATLALHATKVLPILVVDDNADALLLIQRYLLGTPYQFIGAQDAQQALALLEHTLPHAIILDVMLPRQDGWTLLGQIREHPRLRGIPIIVSTIMPQKDLALALGAAEFIRKPIRRPDLLAALARHAKPATGSAS
jgi:CheY-like chemotaxis protein